MGAGGAGAGGDGAGGEGATGGAGGREPEPPNCEPIANGVIDASCGVFVKAGAAPGGDGSKSAPFASLEAATATGASPIYLCLEPLTEPQLVTNPTILYGGVDCANFSWTAAERSQIATCQPGVAGCASDITVPLRIEAVGAVSIERLDVYAPNAIVAGQSSIAIVAAMGSTVTLRESSVFAGNGAPGAMGATGAPGDAGGAGEAGQQAGAASLFGPAGGASSCGVAGGAGGFRSNSPTNLSGAPRAGLVDQNNAGGNGFYTSTGVLNPNCTNGGDGATIGLPGAAGSPGMGLGTIAGGTYVGVVGFAGATGGPGGGGGGGGRLQFDFAPFNSQGGDTFQEGGGGGAGGCGGLGGAPGGFGGSSFAIVSLGGTWSFVDVQLQAASGANGAVGGNGGPGGAGGLGGAGSEESFLFACDGGDGNAGAPGGPGGAGTGGHAAAIAYVGAAPNLTGATTSFGSAGVGPGSASDGVAADLLAF
jgi:hypothetical protein